MVTTSGNFEKLSNVLEVEGKGYNMLVLLILSSRCVSAALVHAGITIIATITTFFFAFIVTAAITL